MSTHFVRASAPPQIPHGHEVVKVLVGPKEKEYLIHKDLLCAASKFLMGPVATSDAQPHQVELPSEQPITFDYFYRWMYSPGCACNSPVVRQAEAEWSVDLFYLKVYRMAGRLRCVGLQLHAFEQIQGTFSLFIPTVPSRDFIQSLFGEEFHAALRMHVVEHIVYWLPRSKDTAVWTQLFNAHEKFATDMALALVRYQSKDCDREHPGIRLGFAKLHGFDPAELETQARMFDVKELTPSKEKILAQAELLPDDPGAATKAGAKKRTAAATSNGGEEPAVKRSSVSATTQTTPAFVISSASISSNADASGNSSNLGTKGSLKTSSLATPKFFGSNPFPSTVDGLFATARNASVGGGSFSMPSSENAGSGLFGSSLNNSTSSKFGATAGIGGSGTFGRFFNANIAPVVPPPSGTRHVAFEPTYEKDYPWNNAFQSITFQPPYQKYSFEELRLADYNNLT